MCRSATALSGLLLGLGIVGSLAGAPAFAQAIPQKPQPTYRSAVMLVPVDVRVIDKNTGVPVTDLRREDFTVFEEDVRQEIRHFAVQSFDAPRGGEAADASLRPADAGGLLARTSPFSVVPQTRRVFLIVLGRGRVQDGPAKALDAAAHFVRNHLLPNDQVAVFAYDRATNFTADHEQAALVIDRFKVENDEIVGGLARPGLAAVYGSRDLPADVQRRIDRVFRGTGTLPYSPVGGAMPVRTREQLVADTRKQTDQLLDNMIAAGRPTPQSESGNTPPAAAPAWEAFDAFASRNMQTLDDTENLYAAIAYMQQLEGEKHLLFMTPNALYFRTLEEYERISATAADARVALDIVWSSFSGPLTAKAMRSLSEDTGGVSSIAEYGQVALDRVDTTTRTGYLLGYYPSDSRRRGEYRRIRVEVNRPGVTVLYRHGYRASEEIPTFDRRTYLTQFRMQAAASYPRDIKDIPVRIHPRVTTEKGLFQLTVDSVIDASRLTFALRDGEYVGRFDVAVVAMDQAGHFIAGQSRALDAKFTPERFAILQKDGLTCTIGMQIPTAARYVRFIVYDYETDRVGTAGTTVF